MPLGQSSLLGLNCLEERMRCSFGQRLSISLASVIGAALLLLAALLPGFPELAGNAAAAVKFETLYRFKGGLDGAWPNGDVVIDGDGVIFGTTQYDGRCGFYPNCGTVYMLTPPRPGESAWKNT